MAEEVKKQIENARTDHRTLRLGPLTATQVGNDIVLESNWADPAEHAAFVAKWIAEKPRLKEEIDRAAKSAKEIIAAHDPIALLTLGALEWSFTKIDSSGEVEPAKDFIAEYVLGLATAIPFDSRRESPTQESIKQLKELVDSLFTNVAAYFGMEFASVESEQRGMVSLRVQELLTFLYQRGDTYRYYQYDFIRSLYAAHDAFFSRNFGFGVEDALTEIRRIAESGCTMWKLQQETLDKVVEATKIVADAVEAGTIPRGRSIEDFRRKAKELPAVQAVLPDLSAVRDALERNPFEILIQSPRQETIAERLSIEFGENGAFADFPRSPGWPTNSGLHVTHPLVKHEGKYYAFVPQIVWRNLKDIFDNWINDAEPSYFKAVVLDPKRETGRSRWLETQAVELLERLLPGCRSCKNVFYNERFEGGGVKRREIDGLVEFDGNLLIVSAKSGQWSLPARRGAPNSMREEIGDLIVDGFEQGLSAKRYIEAEETATFSNENGAPQITFNAKCRPRCIYVINVTLSALGPISIQLNALKGAGLISANELPWSVFINDLRVIADILEGPSEFLFYVQRRLRFNRFEQLHGAEELDLFGYFLDQGLFFDEERLKGVSRFFVGPNTDKLDQYFDKLERSPESASKPALAISSNFRALIHAIEQTRCKGFTVITLYLLNLDGVYHDKISDQITLLNEGVRGDGECHHAFIALGKEFGITIELRPGADGSRNLEKYSALKKYQLKLPTVFYISLAADLVPTANDKARMFRGEWEFDARLESALNKFREAKLQQASATGRKIGRNDPCPCGSGDKFKQCCGPLRPRPKQG